MNQFNTHFKSEGGKVIFILKIANLILIHFLKLQIFITLLKNVVL